MAHSDAAAQRADVAPPAPRNEERVSRRQLDHEWLDKGVLLYPLVDAPTLRGLAWQKKRLDQLTVAADRHAGKPFVPLPLGYLRFGIEPFREQLKLCRRNLSALISRATSSPVGLRATTLPPVNAWRTNQ